MSHAYETTGVHQTTATAEDASGNMFSQSIDVLVNPSGPLQNPNVTITASATGAVVGQPVSFEVSATTPNPGATIASIAIDCTNGPPPPPTVQNGGTATCTFSTPNPSTMVTATAKDSSGQTGEGTVDINVIAQGGYTAIAPACPVPPGNTNGTSTSTPSPSVTPPVAVLDGPYRTFGTQPITVSAANSKPATQLDTSVQPPLVVNQGITSYAFDFGDEPGPESVEEETAESVPDSDSETAFTPQATPTATHSYAASGTYTVTVVVTSACVPLVNAVDEKGTPISVPTFDEHGNVVLMTETASANTIAVVYPPLPNCYPPTGAGPFGPGQCASVATSCSASLTQACTLPPGCGIGQAAGTCSVPSSCTGPIAGSACVTPCIPQGLSPLLLAAACPQPPPTAASPVQVNAGGPYQGAAGATIQFSATVSGSVASNVCTDGSNYGLPGLACTTLVTPASAGAYLWDFGDGATGTGQNVSHTYASPGTYTVNLTVSLGSPGLFTAQTTAVVSSP